MTLTTLCPVRSRQLTQRSDTKVGAAAGETVEGTGGGSEECAALFCLAEQLKTGCNGPPVRHEPAAEGLA